MSIFDQLAAPFPPDAVSWRAQSVTNDGKKAMALCYIDARDVMRRLDEVIGHAGWQDEYTETPKGRLICTIKILCPDVGWIGKSDGAGDTDVEGEKGAISDAFKRAAVKWGVGRYLYDMDAVWAECETYEQNGKKKWEKWTPAGERQLANAIGRGAPSSRPAPEPYVNAEQVARLNAAADDVGADKAAFCTFMGIPDLPSLPASRFDDAMSALHRKKKAA